MNAARLLPALGDLYSRLAEMCQRQPWEPRHVRFSLGYTDGLADGAEIAASVAVGRSCWPRWKAA